MVVLADGSLGYSIPVSTKNLPDGVDQNVHVSISTVDEHGNQLTVSHDHTVHIDLHADAKITIDKVTDDNVLNHFELDKPKQLVSGTVGGDAQVGDAVNIEINGYTFTGKVIDLVGVSWVIKFQLIRLHSAITGVIRIKMSPLRQR